MSFFKKSEDNRLTIQRHCSVFDAYLSPPELFNASCDHRIFSNGQKIIISFSVLLIITFEKFLETFFNTNFLNEQSQI